MITLLWLFQFDQRWICKVNVTLLKIMWLLASLYCLCMAGINIFAFYTTLPCDDRVLKHLVFQTGCLLLEGVLCQIIYNMTMRKLEKKQISRYTDRQDIVVLITENTVRKALVSKAGILALVLGFIQNVWAMVAYMMVRQLECSDLQTWLLKINVAATMLGALQVWFMITCYLFVKTVTLVMSSLFPHTYIKFMKGMQQ